MLNVHPVAAAALAGRGADRARDHGRRRDDRRLRHAAHRRPRLRPGRAPRGDADRPGRRLRRSRRRLAELGGELLVEALDLRGAGRARVHRAGRRAASPTRRRSSPAERRLDPARPPTSSARDGPGPDPAYRRLPRARRRRAARGRAAPAAADGVGRGASTAERGELLLGCGDGALRLERVQPPGGKPMDAAAYLRGHPLPGLRGRRGTPARALAYEMLRAQLRGRRMDRPRLARRAEPRRARRPRARPGPAPAYGAVQRRAGSTGGSSSGSSARASFSIATSLVPRRCTAP